MIAAFIHLAAITHKANNVMIKLRKCSKHTHHVFYTMCYEGGGTTSFLVLVCCHE